MPAAQSALSLSDGRAINAALHDGSKLTIEVGTEAPNILDLAGTETPGFYVDFIFAYQDAEEK